MSYFIVDNGQQAGPFTIEELAEKGLTPTILVWKEGMDNWAPASQVDELKPVVNGKPDADKQDADTDSKPTPFVPHTDDETSSSVDNAVDRGHSRKGCRPLFLWGLLLVIAFAAILAATTCPDRNRHQTTIKENISRAIIKSAGGEKALSTGIGLFGNAIVQNIVDPLLDGVLVYHNYIFFSTTTVEYEGKVHTASVGLFGNVFTKGEDEIADVIKDNFDTEKNEAPSTNEWLTTF